jgi:RNA-directed DNA polymerase
VRARIAARMHEVGLRLHPDKTRSVYCQGQQPSGGARAHSFTFLGYAFRAPGAIKQEREWLCLVVARDQSRGAQAKRDRLRELRIHRQVNLSLYDLAEWLNPIIAGWMTTTAGSTGPGCIPSCGASTST